MLGVQPRQAFSNCPMLIEHCQMLIERAFADDLGIMSLVYKISKSCRLPSSVLALPDSCHRVDSSYIGIGALGTEGYDSVGNWGRSSRCPS